MNNTLQYFIWICGWIILINGIFRWVLGLLFRMTQPDAGVNRDYSYTPTITMMLPCFNEGPAVYETVESIIKSDYPPDSLEVIVTDDCSIDDSWQWIQKAAKDFPRVRPVRNPHNMGKTKTILNALAMSKSEIVCIIDSDTIVAPHAIRELMATMADKRLAGVGGPATIRNSNENILTQFQVYLYYLAFHIGKIVESRFRHVGCVGGQLFAIRRLIFEEIRPDLEKRHWFGCKITDGEDRFITHQLLLHGYETYIELRADNVMVCPSTMKSYWGQQLRWRRSATRDFFFTLRHLHRHVRDCKNPWMALYVYLLTPLVEFVAIIEIVMILFAGLAGDVLFWRVIGYLAMVFVVVALTFDLYKDDKRIKNPAGLLFYLPWYVINNLLLVPLALFTLDAGQWGNRDATNQGRKV